MFVIAAVAVGVVTLALIIGAALGKVRLRGCCAPPGEAEEAAQTPRNQRSTH